MANKQVNAEYGDLLTTLLLCRINNPDDEKSLKICVYRVLQRMKTKDIQAVCWHILKQSSISKWIDEKCAVITKQHQMPLEHFLNWTATGNIRDVAIEL